MRRDLFEDFCREYVRELIGCEWSIARDCRAPAASSGRASESLAGAFGGGGDSKGAPDTGDLLVQIQMVAGACNLLNLEFSWSAA